MKKKEIYKKKVLYKLYCETIFALLATAESNFENTDFNKNISRESVYMQKNRGGILSLQPSYIYLISRKRLIFIVHTISTYYITTPKIYRM